MKDIKNIRKNGGTPMDLKRITALLAALALAASMAACQKAPAEPDTTPSDSSAASSAAESTKKPSAATGTKGSTASSGKDAAPADEPTESSKNGQKETTPGSSSGSEKPTSGSQKPTGKPQQPTEKPSTGSKPSESTAKPTEPKPTTHQHNYKTTTVAATCTTGGYTLHECACGASYKDGQTAALGHSYVDTVIAPTTSSQGYTEHTCSRCGDSYKDSYTDPVRWDTEEVVARICAQGNEYVRSIGLTVDPTAECWVIRESTSGWVPENPEEWLLSRVKEGVNVHAYDPDNPKTNFYITYGSNGRGGWYIYVKYVL